MFRRKRRRAALVGSILTGGLIAVATVVVAMPLLSPARPVSGVGIMPNEPNLAEGTVALPARTLDEPVLVDGKLPPAERASPAAEGEAPEPPVPSGAEPAEEAQTPPALVNYIVRAGDTLSGLAERYDTTVDRLLAANPGLDAARLVTDRLVKVPSRQAAAGEVAPRLVWPAEGTITTPFGVPGSDWIGGYHMGLDVGADTGDLVWAAGEGVIADTGINGRGRGYGTYVLIYHFDGWWTLYAHLSKVYRDVGYPVRKGEPIGEIGMTGYADGPHLHFEVWKDDDKRDPIQFLP